MNSYVQAFGAHTEHAIFTVKTVHTGYIRNHPSEFRVHIKIRFTIEKETIANSLYIHTTNSVKRRNYGERITILP